MTNQDTQRRALRPLIRAGNLEGHLESGEFKLDPANVFPAVCDSARIRTLCIVDYRSDRSGEIRTINPDDFLAFLEQFAFPVSTYGLKDDLLAHCHGDFDRYVTAYNQMKERMRELVYSSRLLLVNQDMLDPATRDRTLDTLRS